MKNIFVFLFLFIIVASPGFSQSKSEKKKLKEENEAKGYETAKLLVSSQTYNFIGNWATTQKGRRLDITTNTGYLKMDSSHADINFPYYGTIHTPGVRLNKEAGIIFKGMVENYTVDFDDKKQKIIVKFEAKGENDPFNFILTVFKNGAARFDVYSTVRNSISYDGELNDQSEMLN
jgi:uncharacterized protein DUF4251